MPNDNSTPRRICPYLTAGTVQVTNLVDASGAPPGAKITPVQCIGPQCHLWEHDPRLPAETGDCSHKLAAIFSATAANQMGTLTGIAARTAVKLGVESIEIIDPSAAPNSN